mgnify:CR=1 FL=1
MATRMQHESFGDAVIEHVTSGCTMPSSQPCQATLGNPCWLGHAGSLAPHWTANEALQGLYLSLAKPLGRRVHNLNLMLTVLAGPLPKWTANQALQVLFLSGNKLTGTLPCLMISALCPLPLFTACLLSPPQLRPL